MSGTARERKPSQETILEGSFLSPSADLLAGSAERAVPFWHGPVTATNAQGVSRISVAIARINEGEKPTHIRRRFTVGY